MILCEFSVGLDTVLLLIDWDREEPFIRGWANEVVILIVIKITIKFWTIWILNPDSDKECIAELKLRYVSWCKDLK